MVGFDQPLHLSLECICYSKPFLKWNNTGMICHWITSTKLVAGKALCFLNITSFNLFPSFFQNKLHLITSHVIYEKIKPCIIHGRDDFQTQICPNAIFPFTMQVGFTIWNLFHLTAKNLIEILSQIPDSCNFLTVQILWNYMDS